MVINVRRLWHVEIYMGSFRYYMVQGFLSEQEAMDYDDIMLRDKPGVRKYVQREVL